MRLRCLALPTCSATVLAAAMNWRARQARTRVASTGSSGRSARWASSKEGPNQTFALTAIGEHLRTDSQISIAGWARLIGQEYFWNTWGRLLVGIECGKNVFHQLHGEDVWTWRAR